MARKTTKTTGAATLDASRRVVLLRGADQYLVGAHTRRLVEALEAVHGEIERFAYDGASTEPAAVLDELRSYGLLQTHKLVILDNADVFLAAARGGEASRPGSRTARELLERYVAEPVDSATLLLRASTWRPGRIDKAIEKVGAIVRCDAPDETQAIQWCLGRCRKAHGCELETEAAGMLVERVGTSLARLDVELAKLAAFVGEGAAIGPAAVRELVGLSREEQAWVVQEALITGTPAAAIGKVRELLEVSRQPEQLLIWAMTDLLRKLHAAAHLLADGTPGGAVARELKLWGPGRDPMLAAARRLAPARLAQLLRLAIETDRGTKSGLGRAARSIESLAVQIADTMNGARDVRRAAR